MAGRKRAGEPGRGPLTKERIHRAAAAYADREGVAGMSMRKLADELGVEAMSLYHHVANKEAILDGMVEVAFSEIDMPVDEPDWKEAMRRRALSARAMMVRHPWAIGLMETRPNPGPASLRHHDAVIGSLRRAGFTIAMTAHAYSVLDSYIYGFALQETTLAFQSSEELGDITSAILEQLPRDQFPYFTEMVVEHALKPGYSFADEFGFGLELVLDGLERALRREQT